MKHLTIWLIIALSGLCLALSAHAAAPGSFAASFVQTRTLPGFDQPLVSHGVMRFSADAGFHWEITQPYHYVFDMRDGVAKEQLPDGSSRTLQAGQTPWLEAVEHIFVSALSGDQSRLDQYFVVVIKPLAHGRHVTLTPKPGAMGKVIERIEVTESSPGHPQHMAIDEASGAHMDMRFTPLGDNPGA
ncbi:MAG: outer membrane lipoprotein carrier protein LolA [Xanthomonadales bacterium]|nr:outer membrane lipoprotein carrier protein LolA [Xanthomonadales bacterium]